MEGHLQGWMTEGLKGQIRGHRDVSIVLVKYEIHAIKLKR